MIVETKRFGKIELDDSGIITFPEGLIGFPDFRQFTVLDLDSRDETVKWLQSTEEPSLGFVVISPRSIFPAYAPEVSGHDVLDLGAADPGELVVLAVVTVPKDIRNMTANLQAPILVNPTKRLAKQVITASPEYTTKHSVFSALESLMKRTG